MSADLQNLQNLQPFGRPPSPHMSHDYLVQRPSTPALWPMGRRVAGFAVIAGARLHNLQNLHLSQVVLAEQCHAGGVQIGACGVRLVAGGCVSHSGGFSAATACLHAEIGVSSPAKGVFRNGAHLHQPIETTAYSPRIETRFVPAAVVRTDKKTAAADYRSSSGARHKPLNIQRSLDFVGFPAISEPRNTTYDGHPVPLFALHVLASPLLLTVSILLKYKEKNKK